MLHCFMYAQVCTHAIYVVRLSYAYTFAHVPSIACMLFVCRLFCVALPALYCNPVVLEKRYFVLLCTVSPVCDKRK